MSNQIDIASLLNGSNAGFIADLYQRYLENPGAVDPSWQSLFAELRDDRAVVDADVRGASWTPKPQANGTNGHTAAPAAGEVSVEQLRAATIDSIRALML